MNRSIVTMADNATSDGLDGQWGEILRSGTYDGETYTPGDLDSLVSEYQKRKEGDKAPVALGLPPSTSNPGVDQPIGRIDALRRTGNSVQAKFANIEPRAEQLHARGVFPKKSIQLKRSSDGISLQRVGLIHPVFRDYWHNDETPSLDALMKQNMGNKDHIFQESPLANQWLELFRAGDYGDKGNFSDADLDQIVRNFQPGFHEPPAVIGHPEQDAPAYAWVDGLKRNGDTLLGKFKQVDPKFEEMVKAGRFKKRSIALYRTAKGWMLRHVGFLGALPPEVKGLANAKFKEDRIRFMTLTFDESGSRADAAITRLKSGGYWGRDLDYFNFSEAFRVLEDSPVLDMLVTFVETLRDELGVDPGSTRLAHRARSYARFHGVSFGEALDQVRQTQIQDGVSAKAVASGLPGARLAQLAHEVARSRGVSFGEALSEVAAEHPELTI